MCTVSPSGINNVKMAPHHLYLLHSGLTLLIHTVFQHENTQLQQLFSSLGQSTSKGLNVLNWEILNKLQVTAITNK